MIDVSLSYVDERALLTPSECSKIKYCAERHRINAPSNSPDPTVAPTQAVHRRANS